MAPKPLTLRFGDQTFEIRPLTVDQVEALENTVNDSEIAKSPTGLGKAILGVALARDHGATSVGEIESTLPELATAMADVLKAQCGFRRDGLFARVTATIRLRRRRCDHAA